MTKSEHTENLEEQRTLCTFVNLPRVDLQMLTGHDVRQESYEYGFKIHKATVISGRVPSYDT